MKDHFTFKSILCPPYVEHEDGGSLSLQDVGIRQKGCSALHAAGQIPAYTPSCQDCILGSKCMFYVFHDF